MKIEPKYNKGQYDTAKRFSKASKILAIAGIAVTLVVVITCLAIHWPSFEEEAQETV